MARLIAATAALSLAVFALVGSWPASRAAATGAAPAPQQATDDKSQARAEFKAAGVCARCHVVSVLEWGISGHVKSVTDCQSCHGPSRNHVANERNEVKPDRLPRDAQIAKLCVDCHDAGCPKTLEVASCQKCHHHHALLNPDAKLSRTDDEQTVQLLARWEQFRKKMQLGESLVEQSHWDRARAVFAEALELLPGHRLARARLEMCRRRLDPKMSGFEIRSDGFDPATGMPTLVHVQELDMPMVLVTAGAFDLGSEHLPQAQPVHTVAIDAFYLGKYEVTQGQWRAIMGTNPSEHQGDVFPDADHMPVERVSWDDCQQFIRRLNARVSGGGFRLPSEAEWEYACVAGSRQADLSPLSNQGWFRENSRRDPESQGDLRIESLSPRPVGTRQPNAWGLCDMRGNVAEWCSSLYRPYLYDASDGRERPDSSGLRVLRGGGFADSAASLDPAMRHAERPHRRVRWNGLRLARTAPPTSN